MVREGAVYYTGTHRYSWKAGKPLRVIGVEWCANGAGRACFHVIDDETGEDDYCPISDTTHYALSSSADIAAGKVPAVQH